MGVGVAGTALYMAPEVMRGEVTANDIDGLKRADVYAAGVTLYQLVQGDARLNGGDIDQDDVREYLPGHPTLADVVIQATRPRPARRYADMGEMAQALTAAPRNAQAAAAEAARLAAERARAEAEAKAEKER
jgi:serine/threonine protein kinase